MQKRIYLLLVLLITIIFVPIKASAAVGSTIKIAGDENYPPYEFVDKNGNYTGFNVDIMKAISSNLGRNIEISPMPWQEAIHALEDKKVDVIQGMARSTVREEKFNFTDALVHNSQAIFVRKDTNNIYELENLTGLTVGIQSDDINQEIVGRIPEAKITVFSNQEQALLALLDGRLDAFIGNRLTGIYILQNLRQNDRIKIAGEPLYPTDYASAALKDNPEVLELLNQGLDNIKRSGEYERIYNKWFGETLSDKTIVWKRLLFIISTALVFVMIVIGLVFYWNRSLKKIVDVRTGELAELNKALIAHQRKLEQSNRLGKKILGSILDGIITFDIDGRILLANSSAKELLQLKNKDAKSIRELKFNDNFILEGFIQALEGNVAHKDLEWKKDNGETLYIDCSIYPIKAPEESVEGIIIVLHDYTESKLLNVAKEYDKLKTEFFANISHELKTPLSIISAAAQLLEFNSKSEDLDSIRNVVDKSTYSIRQNINRLTRLINNIIDITKADTGFLELHLRNCNIVNVIEEITMSAVNLIENKGISIEFDTDIEEKIMACDIEKIERVMLNLLSNSVKFTPDNGNIFVKVKDDKEFITISVRDTGIGIPKDKQEIIFERFRQVDKSISRNNEGSGIGLSLVKSLVELHRGSIKVESSYGFGSEFIIRLPINELENGIVKHEVEPFNPEKTEMEFSDIYF